MRVFLLCVVVLISRVVFSQTAPDTVLLLNGSMVVSTVLDTTGGVTAIKNPKHPEKNDLIENDRIFSITNASGEHVLYVFDSLQGNEFTVDEMRYFIKGEQDADKGFKAHGSFYGNLAIGALSGVTGYFLCPIPPFLFVSLTGIPKVKIKKETVSNLDYLKQDAYLMGYERVARKKRKMKSLLGGGIGLGVGLGTFFILKSTGNELIK